MTIWIRVFTVSITAKSKLRILDQKTIWVELRSVVLASLTILDIYNFFKYFSVLG